MYVGMLKYAIAPKLQATPVYIPVRFGSKW